MYGLPSVPTLLRHGSVLALMLSATACQINSKGDTVSEKAGTSDTEFAPRVSFVEPTDGAELTGPAVRIVLATENITLAPAGDTTPGTGHHHLLVNGAPPAAGEAIPAGVPTIVHLGKAQTSYELTNLSPGEYTVIAVLGDLAHRRINPQVLDTVRFRVR
jgi:hypothetical protein